MVHVESCVTIIHTLYLPVGTGTPDTLIGRFTSSVVAKFAPGVHTSPQCTARVPNTTSRPRSRGRE
jgi:hypothetical protein